MPKKGKDWFALVICLLLPNAAGAVGALFTVSAIPLWYETLILPSFAPPNWVFGPVWTLLYTLMGLSLYMVWRSRGGSVAKGRARKHGLQLFGVQLILNALWSILFFGMRDPLSALVDLGLLLIFILLTTAYFFKVNRAAGFLMVPYLAWVVFAGVLNAAIVYLN